jgi:tRNA1(Val) A37 N6-methylase TrmN6
MPKYISKQYTEKEKQNILQKYNMGLIPKANIPLDIFKNNIQELIDFGIYWEDWNDDNDYRSLFKKLEQMSVIDKIEIIKGEKFLNWGNVSFVLLANVFFKHMWEARSHDKPSLYDIWHDPIKMQKLLDKFLRDKKIFRSHEKTMKFFRKFLRSLSGGYFTYNYKPDIAKIIYELYGRRGKVFDFSMGWGARLVGFLASSCKEYVGVDVNHKNFKSYDMIVKAYSKKGFRKKKFDFIECPAEDFRPKKYKEYFDLCFSSPPYFIKEIYSSDENQHHLKHGDDYNDWIDGFLLPMIQNQWYLLKKGGRLVINIADVTIKGKIYPLEKDTLSIAKQTGFKIDEILNQKLNKSPFMRNKDVNERTQDKFGFKFERIYVFIKE